MVSPEPLRGSVRLGGTPARLLGSEEVDALVAMNEESEEADETDEGENDDDHRPD